MLFLLKIRIGFNTFGFHSLLGCTMDGGHVCSSINDYQTMFINTYVHMHMNIVLVCVCVSFLEVLD